MYTIVALAYLFMAGQTTDAPIVFNNHKLFATLDECKVFLNSPEGQSTSWKLAKYVKSKEPAGVEVAVTVGCERTERSAI